jgi:TrmH family RNA methyltransferase
MALTAPITSRSNTRVKALRASFGGRVSQPGELVGIEGEHLVVEALRSGLRLASVFVREGSEAVLKLPGLLALRQQEIVVLARGVFESAVETNAPQGIAAMLEIPEPRAQAAPRITLLLEEMQDPGNLGTLLRSAEAFGVEQVLLTPGTVNTWNPKVMRASAGSVFRVPVLRGSLPELAATVQSQGATIYAAVAREAGAVSVLDTRLVSPCVLMIGNEGAGLSEEALAMAHHRLHIPCEVESLNAAVAGSLLLYEALRQQAQQKGSVG